MISHPKKSRIQSSTILWESNVKELSIVDLTPSFISSVISRESRNLSFLFVFTNLTTRSLDCARDDRKKLSFRILRLNSVQVPWEIHVSTARRNPLRPFTLFLTARSLTFVRDDRGKCREMTRRWICHWDKRLSCTECRLRSPNGHRTDQRSVPTLNMSVESYCRDDPPGRLYFIYSDMSSLQPSILD